MVKYLLVMVKDEDSLKTLKTYLSGFVYIKKVEWILFDTLKGLKEFVVK